MTVTRSTFGCRCGFEGVAGVDPLNGFGNKARDSVRTAIEDMKPEHVANRTILKENLRIHLKRFIQQQLSSKPVIVTTIVEV